MLASVTDQIRFYTDVILSCKKLFISSTPVCAEFNCCCMCSIDADFLLVTSVKMEELKPLLYSACMTSSL